MASEECNPRHPCPELCSTAMGRPETLQHRKQGGGRLAAGGARLTGRKLSGRLGM